MRPGEERLWEVDAKEDVSSTDYLSVRKNPACSPPKISTVPPLEPAKIQRDPPVAAKTHADRNSTTLHHEDSQNSNKKPKS